jgi:hypothetical protein
MSTVEQEPRSPGTVAYNIYEAIPKEYTDFRNSLTQFIRDLMYKSPEMLNHINTWLQLDVIMKTYIRTIDDADFEWKRNAIDIYTGKMK